jgi:ribosomal protein L7/L12
VILRVRLKLGVGLLAGAFIGTAAVSGMHAQGKAPVYLITEIDVTNPDAYGKEFAPTEQATIKAAGAKLIVIGGAGGANAKPTPQASLAPVNPRGYAGPLRVSSRGASHLLAGESESGHRLFVGNLSTPLRSRAPPPSTADAVARRRSPGARWQPCTRKLTGPARLAYGHGQKRRGRIGMAKRVWDEEKTGVTIMLRAVGRKKMQVVQEVHEITGLGLMTSKDMVEGKKPVTIKNGVSKEEAEKIKTRLEWAGAKVELKYVRGTS